MFLPDWKYGNETGGFGLNLGNETGGKTGNNTQNFCNQRVLA
jgi:hypothetical protein